MVGVFSHRGGWQFYGHWSNSVFLLECMCVCVCGCVWYTGGSVCGRHAYAVTDPAADSRATIGPDSETEDLTFIMAKRTCLLLI